MKKISELGRQIHLYQEQSYTVWKDIVSPFIFKSQREL